MNLNNLIFIHTEELRTYENFDMCFIFSYCRRYCVNLAEKVALVHRTPHGSVCLRWVLFRVRRNTYKHLELLTSLTKVYPNQFNKITHHRKKIPFLTKGKYIGKQRDFQGPSTVDYFALWRLDRVRNYKENKQILFTQFDSVGFRFL